MSRQTIWEFLGGVPKKQVKALLDEKTFESIEIYCYGESYVLFHYPAEVQLSDDGTYGIGADYAVTVVENKEGISPEIVKGIFIKSPILLQSKNPLVGRHIEIESLYVVINNEIYCLSIDEYKEALEEYKGHASSSDLLSINEYTKVLFYNEDSFYNTCGAIEMYLTSHNKPSSTTLRDEDLNSFMDGVYNGQGTKHLESLIKGISTDTFRK